MWWVRQVDPNDISAADRRRRRRRQLTRENKVFESYLRLFFFSFWFVFFKTATLNIPKVVVFFLMWDSLSRQWRQWERRGRTGSWFDSYFVCFSVGRTDGRTDGRCNENSSSSKSDDSWVTDESDESIRTHTEEEKGKRKKKENRIEGIPCHWRCVRRAHNTHRPLSSFFLYLLVVCWTVVVVVAWTRKKRGAMRWCDKCRASLAFS